MIDETIENLQHSGHLGDLEAHTEAAPKSMPRSIKLREIVEKRSMEKSCKRKWIGLQGSEKHVSSGTLYPGTEGDDMKRLIAAMILLFIPVSAFAITFPQFAIGGGYECLMLISNKTSLPWTGDIYIFSGNDQLWPSSWYVNGVNFTGERGVSLEIPGNASVKLRFTGNNQTRTGYLEIYGAGLSSSYGVSIAYFYQFLLGDDIITSTGSPALAASCARASSTGWIAIPVG
jgi:hypothetical protein